MFGAWLPFHPDQTMLLSVRIPKKKTFSILRTFGCFPLPNKPVNNSETHTFHSFWTMSRFGITQTWVVDLDRVWGTFRIILGLCNVMWMWNSCCHNHWWQYKQTTVVQAPSPQLRTRWMDFASGYSMIGFQMSSRKELVDSRYRLFLLVAFYLETAVQACTSPKKLPWKHWCADQTRPDYVDQTKPDHTRLTRPDQTKLCGPDQTRPY